MWFVYLFIIISATGSILNALNAANNAYDVYSGRKVFVNMLDFVIAIVCIFIIWNR